jgi:hypothetical protein
VTPDEVTIVVVCVVRWIRTFIALVFACALTGQPDRVSLIKLRTINGALQEVRIPDAPATAIIFVSTVCPMSMEYSERLNQLVGDYSPRHVRMLIVNGNVNESDTDVEKQRREAGIRVPIYRDNGDVADLLGATATPTAVVIDRAGAIRYRGVIDNSRNPARVTKRLLRSALDSILAGSVVEIPRTKVMGCSIKSAR